MLFFGIAMPSGTGSSGLPTVTNLPADFLAVSITVTSRAMLASARPPSSARTASCCLGSCVIVVVALPAATHRLPMASPVSTAKVPFSTAMVLPHRPVSSG